MKGQSSERPLKSLNREEWAVKGLGRLRLAEKLTLFK